MAETQPRDLLAELPQEITLLILEHLKWPETLPLRNLNKLWREFMDYYFVQADDSSIPTGSDSELKLDELSKWTRNISLSKTHISALEDWSALVRQCPRISTLCISFNGVKLRTAYTLMSDFGSFRNLTVLTLERTMYRAIHKLIPLLSTSCLNLQDLRINVLPANYERFEETATWLQRTRVVQDMPQLRSLDLEFRLIFEIYDDQTNRELCTRVNGDLHRPIIQLITSAKNLETLKIKTTPGKYYGGDVDSYARCIAQLHQTNPKLQSAHFNRLQIVGTPALAAVSLTIIECERPAFLAYSTRAELMPDYDTVWNSKLRSFTQKDNCLEVPFPRELEKLDIDGHWCVVPFLQTLRDRNSEEEGLPLLSLTSLRLRGTGKNMRPYLFTNSGDLTFADLEILVKMFPNLEKLDLIDQEEVDKIDFGKLREGDEKPDGVAELDPEVEYFSYTDDESYLPGRAAKKRKRVRRYFGRADPEEYLRANLPRLQPLTIT